MSLVVVTARERETEAASQVLAEERRAGTVMAEVREATVVVVAM